MCKEDIRLSRKANAHAASTITGGSQQAAVFPANPNRYSLSISIEAVNGPYDNIDVILYTLVGGNQFPLAGVSQDHPADVVNINDVGAAICGAIFVASVGTNSPDFTHIGETTFDESLEDL